MIYVKVSYIGKSKFLQIFWESNLHLRMERIQTGYWNSHSQDIQAAVLAIGIVIMANNDGE
jgi:hypothetical protein